MNLFSLAELRYIDIGIYSRFYFLLFKIIFNRKPVKSRYPVFPGRITALDPCCGEGAALEQLTAGISADTYGVELDTARARQAAKRLTHVICADALQARISKNAFSLLWLNPPYDYDDGRRLEHLFLRATADCLQPGGVLILIVQEKRLPRMEALITSRFDNISCQPFPPDEYAAFGQAVLMATKRPAPAEPYTVPPGKTVHVFRSGDVEPKELERLISGSPLWQRLNSNTLAAVNRRAPLPLHRGHLGLLLAAGKLDGVHGSGPDLHIVRGTVRKHESTAVSVNDDGSTETRVTESFRVAIKMLTPDGTIRVL